MQLANLIASCLTQFIERIMCAFHSKISDFARSKSYSRSSRRRPRAYTPTSNTASHGNHDKINSWVSFSFLYGYRAPLGGPSGRRSSAIMCCKENCHEPLNRSTLFEILEVRKASQWKSLQGLDNTVLHLRAFYEH